VFSSAVKAVVLKKTNLPQDAVVVFIAKAITLSQGF
jgi:hypothetical protein